MSQVPDDPALALPATTRRGRLQRRLRRQRLGAVRDASIGALVAVAVLLVASADLSIGATGTTAGDGPATIIDGPDPDAAFTATMVGDLMFARHVERVVEHEGLHAPLEHVAPLLEGDYVSGNLEQVISDRKDLPEADKLIHLRSPTTVTDALVEAGFTTLSLANNHAMDHGIPGLRDTITALDAAGLEHAGGGETLDEAVEINLQEHGDLTVATLSFTDVFVEGFIARSFQGGVLQAEPDLFIPLIQAARAEADLVITHFHFGEEYDNDADARQRELAELAAAAGTDIVVGHHPHVLQPVERIDDTLVLYSMGNLVFDQGWSRTRESAIARYTLAQDGTARLELVPVYVREGTPQVLTGPLATYRRERIFQRLRGDGLDWSREDGVLVTELDHRHVVQGSST